MAKITVEQQEELNELLSEDIMERYNNSEYWSEGVVEQYYNDNNIVYESH